MYINVCNIYAYIYIRVNSRMKSGSLRPSPLVKRGTSRTCICVCVCMCVRELVHMYIYIYMYIYVRIHIYIYVCM